jgi:hypothetical protein
MDVKSEEPKAEIVANPNGAGTRLAHRAKTGLFAKRPKPQSPEQVRKALAQKLTAPLDESGRTHLEDIYDAQLEIAKDTNIDRGTASVKAAEFCLKSAGMMEREKAQPAFTSIVFNLPPLPMMGEIENQPHEELRPHFPSGEPQLLGGEVISQNDPPLYRGPSE